MSITNYQRQTFDPQYFESMLHDRFSSSTSTYSFIYFGTVKGSMQYLDLKEISTNNVKIERIIDNASYLFGTVF